jgi:hypothetical protein
VSEIIRAQRHWNFSETKQRYRAAVYIRSDSVYVYLKLHI